MCAFECVSPFSYCFVELPFPSSIIHDITHVRDKDAQEERETQRIGTLTPCDENPMENVLNAKLWNAVENGSDLKAGSNGEKN